MSLASVGFVLHCRQRVHNENDGFEDVKKVRTMDVPSSQFSGLKQKRAILESSV
jgi:hypothetical protein